MMTESMAKPKAKRASRASGARRPAAKATKTAKTGTKAKGPAKPGAQAKPRVRAKPGAKETKPFNVRKGEKVKPASRLPPSQLVRRGLAVRDRFALGEYSVQGLAWWRTHLTRQLEDLVTPIKSHPANETFAKFLERHLNEIFTFRTPVAQPTRAGVVSTLLPAANYLGEQAIRPAVVNRKVWGGNRTDRGATAQSTLSTIVLTALQCSLDPLAWLQRLRESPCPLHLHR